MRVFILLNDADRPGGRLAAQADRGSRLAFRHVVFDLDGTLADTKDDLARAVNVALTALGLPSQDPRVLLSYVGHGARVLLARALGEAHQDRLDEGLATFLAWYGDHLLDRSVVYPGLRAVIETLAGEGVVYSILTNKPAALGIALVDGLGLGAWFPRLVGGDTLLQRKPDPAGLRHLIGASGVPAVATLMVGDSAIDVATGRNAGVAICGVAWGFVGGAIVEAEPDAIAATPADLLPIVRGGIV